MIDVKEAKRRLMANVLVMPTEAVPLLNALGRFAVNDVVAPFDHPLFDCSAMDGYAFRFSEEVKAWTVVGDCLLYTSPSPRDRTRSRMPSSA